MRARYAFVSLAVLTLLLAAASVLFTVNYVGESNRKFCQVIEGVTGTSVQRPPKPADAPAREKQFELYQAFTRLGHDLGC